MRKFYDKVVGFLMKAPADAWICFAAGLVISAFFGITLGMKVGIVPTFFAAVLKDFFKQFTAKEEQKWNYVNFIACILGGLVIQIFQVI